MWPAWEWKFVSRENLSDLLVRVPSCVPKASHRLRIAGWGADVKAPAAEDEAAEALHKKAGEQWRGLRL